jgi:hypothetical protein
MNDELAFLNPFQAMLASTAAGTAAPKSKYKLRTESPYDLKTEEQMRRWDRAEDIREKVAFIETGGNYDTKAIGDKHLVDKAYGLFQFRKPALEEVNKALKANGLKHQYTLNDMLDEKKATDAFRIYTYYNAKYFEKEFGRSPTDEELMLAHNTSYGSVPKGMAKANVKDSYIDKIRNLGTTFKPREKK